MHAYVHGTVGGLISCICGHNIYKDIMNPLVGGVAVRQRSPHCSGRYSVNVKKGVVVGLCSLLAVSLWKNNRAVNIRC